VKREEAAKAEAKSALNRLEAVQRASEAQEEMMAQTIREVTNAAAAKTNEVIRATEADSEEVRTTSGKREAAARQEAHEDRRQNTELRIEIAERLREVEELNALRIEEGESSRLREAELNSKIRMIQQEANRLRQHQIDVNTQMEVERKMFVATTSHLEAEFKLARDSLRRVEGANIRLQGELHQAVRKANVAEDTMREHLLGRALAEPLGESQRGIAPPLPQDYKSEPYRDAKVMGAHLEAKAAPYNTEAPLEPTLKSKSTLYPLGPQAASVHVVGEESYFPPVIDGADGGKVDWASRYQIKAKLKEPAAKPSEAQ